jgi:hypothetical protein
MFQFSWVPIKNYMHKKCIAFYNIILKQFYQTNQHIPIVQNANENG